jgi:heptosyltransferase-2
MRNVAKDNILVWLPSPMGDAILCTPALRAIRKRFDSAKITFFGSSAIRQVLSPSDFADTWLEQNNGSVFASARTLRDYGFTQAILFKNSFGSALACFLAGIPVRTGYAREGRGILLTNRLHPPRLPSGDFEPISMVDYYLAIASRLDADVQDRHIELSVEPKDAEAIKEKLPRVFDRQGPLVILVPGAAAGPSKRWPAERFAKLADWLIGNYKATIVLSVAPNPQERQIAEQIISASSGRLVNLGDTPISISELKALFAVANLVICNDTGPRHVAIGLKQKVITLVGPNNPEWTDPGYSDEIFLRGDVPCAPCDKNICRMPSHLCMEAINVEMVCEAAAGVLEARPLKRKINKDKPKPAATPFFVKPAYKSGLEKLGLSSIDAVFGFQAGRSLSKDNLARHRSRIEFQIDSPAAALFLKRYDHPPITTQLKHWFSVKKRISLGLAEFDAMSKLAVMGINTPSAVAWGQQYGMLFEKRSFVIIEKVPDGESLERNLPDFFNGPPTLENLKKRRQFIRQLAAFVKRFHDTGYRHQDLYLSHIFRTIDGRFCLIDLARVLKPWLLGVRYLVKDVAQLHYSAPACFFSNVDRIRFYLAYTGRLKLTPQDKNFIRKTIRKARRMARHDAKHGRPVPFANQADYNTAK